MDGFWRHPSFEITSITCRRNKSLQNQTSVTLAFSRLHVRDQIVQRNEWRPQVAGSRFHVRGGRREEVRSDPQGDRGRVGRLRWRAIGSTAVRRVCRQIARRAFLQGESVSIKTQ